MNEAELTEALEAFISRRSGGAAAVSNVERLAGGASCSIYGFVAGWDGGEPRRLVLRVEAPGKEIGSNLASEFELLGAAKRAGVTVPSVFWYGDVEEGLGGRFFIMERIEGEALARRLLRDDRYQKARAALPAQLARELARIHSIDPDDEALAGLRSKNGDDTGKGFAISEVAKWRQILEMVGAEQPWPVLELAGRWLELNAPQSAKAALVHGDFRIGNVMFDERGLTAVLDWELSHIGDPLEDVGWLAVRSWRYGADDKAIGGLCSREQFLEEYEAETGRDVSPEHVRYWELFGNWRWAIICVGQQASHKAGAHPDVELASLGRRVAEVEWEILSLLEEA